MAPKFEPDRFISPGTARRCFGIDSQALKQAVADGLIPGVLERNRVRVRENDLIAAIETGILTQSPRFLGLYDGKLKEVAIGVFRTVV